MRAVALILSLTLAVAIGVFRDGWWYLDTDLDGRYDAASRFGRAGDRPVCADWNGDGLNEIGVIRCDPEIRRRCAWYLDMNGNMRWDRGVDKKLWYGRESDVLFVVPEGF